jgi:hypothetical protein
MPSDHYDRDEDDYKPPPKKSLGNPTLVIGLVVGGALVLVLLVVVVLVSVFWLKAEPKAAEGDAPTVVERNQPAGGKVGDAKKVYTRDVFRDLVMGKTTADVIAAVGRPGKTSDHPDGTPKTWYYYGRVMNPATDKPDDAMLDFQNGTVIGVRW